MTVVKVPLHGRRGTGLVAVVDTPDIDLVHQYRWHAHIGSSGPIYARTTINNRKPAMHTVITGLVNVDHINGDSLDNRRSNLRPADKSENGVNQQKRPGTSSVYKGVTWNAKCQKWQPALSVKGKRLYPGLFVDEEDAARAYDEVARLHFGRFATFNFPLPGERSALIGGD